MDARLRAVFEFLYEDLKISQAKILDFDERHQYSAQDIADWREFLKQAEGKVRSPVGYVLALIRGNRNPRDCHLAWYQERSALQEAEKARREARRRSRVLKRLALWAAAGATYTDATGLRWDVVDIGLWAPKQAALFADRSTGRLEQIQTTIERQNRGKLPLDDPPDPDDPQPEPPPALGGAVQGQ